MPSRNKIRRLSQFFGTGLFSVFALLGCASGPKQYEIKAAADPVINRDVTGKPLSVVVHVYQLKDAGEFSKLTFDTLASGRPVSDLLGKNLLEMNEIMLVPGGKHVSTDKVHQDAKHVGIVAFFRHPDEHYWRMLIEADQVRSSGLNFRVQDCFLSLTAPKPSLIPGQPANPPAACAGNEVRTISTVAGPNAAPVRSSTTPQSSRRSNALDMGRQAAESLLTKKP